MRHTPVRIERREADATTWRAPGKVDAPGRAGVKRGVRRALLLALVPAMAACDRGPAGTTDTAAGAVARPARAAYDADSAARGLLPPEFAAVLAVEPLLERMDDTSAAEGRYCKLDTLPQLGHETLRFDVRRGDTTTTVFARRTPQGELRRAEVLRRLPDRTALGLTWDASERATVVQEFSGGTVKKTTNRDADAPLARALRYVGRRAVGTKCGNGESGVGRQ